LGALSCTIAKLVIVPADRSTHVAHDETVLGGNQRDRNIPEQGFEFAATSGSNAGSKHTDDPVTPLGEVAERYQGLARPVPRSSAYSQ